jgi:hypothetical protein
MLKVEKRDVMKTDRYKLSFTAASISLNESVKIAEVYLQLRNWDQVKDQVRRGNLLQSRTQSSAVRLYRELAQRLQTLSDDQLELLVDGSIQEQKQLLWLAVCKLYVFIQEFAIEILHEKFLTINYELTELDYDAFFNRKADWHGELDQITDSTRNKIKQVVFRILREADIISEGRIIMPALLSQRVVEALQPDAPMSFKIFPVSVTDNVGG